MPSNNSTLGLISNTLSGTVYIKKDGRIAFQGLNNGKCQVKRYDETEPEVFTNNNSICSKPIYKNLIINGYGEYGNNTNFEQFTYDSNNNDFYLEVSNGNNVAYSSMFSPVNPDKKYVMKMDIYSSKLTYNNLVGFSEADIDKNDFHANHTMYVENTLTTLAKNLKNGDKVVYLSNLSNWNLTSSTPNYQRGFIFWNYKNSTGYQYPPLTYSRNYFFDLYSYDSINKSNNTIILSKPWNGGTYIKGTQLSESSSGATYKYALSSNLTIDSSDYKTYTSPTITGTNYNNSSYYSFNPATKYIKIFTEFNYNYPQSSPVYTHIRNIIFEEID